ncbi:MAG TPA: hypothetical protein VIH13_03550 [Candidatus Hydromicrobium sp.]|nr:hypothetical protein [Nitrospirota bacterium]
MTKKSATIAKVRLLMMIGVILLGVSFEARAQQVVKEKAYQLSLPAGWEKTEQLPQGIDVGFRKKLGVGEYAVVREEIIRNIKTVRLIIQL